MKGRECAEGVGEKLEMRNKFDAARLFVFVC